MTIMKTTRGWGPWKKHYYSICSRHQKSITTCKHCRTGQWYNVWRSGISNMVFKYCPKIWKYFTNKKTKERSLRVEKRKDY